MPKPDTEYRPVHHRLFDRFPAVMRGERGATFHLTELLNRALGGDSAIGHAAAGRHCGWSWKAQLRRQVRDPALRKKLQPDYPIGCKRILFSNDWYPALARDHVDVVTDAVAAIEPTGVRTADGTLHEADVLIWGTGFSATDFLRTIRVIGRDGVELHDVWRDGATAYLGIAVPGFPNLFCIYGPNTNLGGSSIIGMMEAQAGWIAQVARRIADSDRRAFEVRREVAERYDREMQSRLGRSVVGRLRQLVPRRRPDHHELAGPGRGVPGPAGPGRLVGPGLDDQVSERVAGRLPAHRDPPGLGERLDVRGRATDPPEPGGADAAERDVRLVVHGLVVDVHDPGRDLLGERQRRASRHG